MLVSYICFFVCASAQTSVSLPRLVCAKDPPPPLCASCAPPPPVRAKSPQMPPFAAYQHSTPAALTVTQVNDVSGPFFGEWGLWAPSQVLSLCIYNMLMVFTISKIGLLVADAVDKPQTALACCMSECHHSAYG